MLSYNISFVFSLLIEMGLVLRWIVLFSITKTYLYYGETDVVFRGIGRYFRKIIDWSLRLCDYVYFDVYVTQCLISICSTNIKNHGLLCLITNDKEILPLSKLNELSLIFNYDDYKNNSSKSGRGLSCSMFETLLQIFFLPLTLLR